MESSVLNDGRIVINDKFCRVRDDEGVIVVKNLDDVNEIIQKTIR